jgi:hypothetical protein
MKLLIVSLLCAFALTAEEPATPSDPPKIPDAEKLKLQDARINLLTIENQMAQLQSGQV